MTTRPKSLTQKLKEAKAETRAVREWAYKCFARDGRCCSCFYFQKDNRDDSRDVTAKGSCHRYPDSLKVMGSHWCGEYLIHYNSF